MKNLLYLIIMTFCIVVIGCNKVEQAKTDVENEDKFQVNDTITTYHNGTEQIFK